MSLGYKIVNLDYMLQELTEEKTINILKEFSCVQNKDKNPIAAIKIFIK